MADPFQDRQSFVSRLESGLLLNVPYEGIPRRPLQVEKVKEPIPAAVLISIASGIDGPSVLITRRTQQVETHKGQMAFPGGHRDPEDQDAIATALREAHEEVGLDPEWVRVIGQLPELPTVTGFLVTPVVGWVARETDQIALTPAPFEIDGMFWIPMTRLWQVYRRESIEHGGLRYPIDVFEVDGHRIWGVTGTLLKNLLDRITRVG